MDTCKFACTQVEWLGFNINSEETKPLNEKWRLSSPKTFKKLTSFMGSIHHLTKYIPKLAQTAAALRPLLKIQRNLNHLIGHQSTAQLSKSY